jgi:hypothetical protein
VKKQLTWFRRGDHSEVRLFHWVDASQPLVSTFLTSLWPLVESKFSVRCQIELTTHMFLIIKLDFLS